MIFHLAFPVDDIKESISFYEKLGAKIGRVTETNFIMDFYGSQLVGHKHPVDLKYKQKGVYPRHFGVIFEDSRDLNIIYKLAESAFFHKLDRNVICNTRFNNLPHEHVTVSFKDPSGNMLEFKHYTNYSAIFGTGE